MRSGAKEKKRRKKKKKFVNLVDLVKTQRFDLQRFVSIQPRTSLSKFANNSPKVRTEVRNILGSPKKGFRTLHEKRSGSLLRTLHFHDS